MSENFSPDPNVKNKETQPNPFIQDATVPDEIQANPASSSTGETTDNTQVTMAPSQGQELAVARSSSVPAQQVTEQYHQQPQPAQATPYQSGMPTVNVNMVAPPMIVAAKSTAVAYLLWFFLGGWGAHKFYLQQTGIGVAYLVTWLLGLLTTWIFIGWFFIGIVAILLIIDAFLIPGRVRDVNSQMARASYGQH